MKFEIHITGDDSIKLACQELGFKTISIDLLRPDLSVIRVEHMVSHVIGIDLGSGSGQWALDTKAKLAIDFVMLLSEKLEAMGVNVVRTKVECPGYANLQHMAKYAECHFEFTGAELSAPLARNQSKTKILATSRENNVAYIGRFLDYYRLAIPGCETELCLYDTNVLEDSDWFDHYINELTI